MSYEVGTHIDLSHMNVKSGTATTPKKSMLESALVSEKSESRKLYEAGTQFIFQWTPAGLKSAIRIPVMAV